MTFPKHLLADHEKVIFDLRPHWVAIVPAALWTIVLGIALVAAFVFSEGTVATVIAIVILLAWIVLAIVPFLRWRFTMFVLTTDRLITRSGVVAKQSKEIPLERINDVSFSQTVLERMFGAGDLLLESAGERGQSRIANVRKPEQVQLMIYKTTEENNARMMRGGAPTPPPSSPRGDTIPEQIAALARLKDQGVLSDAEFKTKKQELLKRL